MSEPLPTFVVYINGFPDCEFPSVDLALQRQEELLRKRVMWQVKVYQKTHDNEVISHNKYVTAKMRAEAMFDLYCRFVTSADNQHQTEYGTYRTQHACFIPPEHAYQLAKGAVEYFEERIKEIPEVQL